MYNSMMKSENQRVRCLTKLSSSNPRSIIGGNLHTIGKRLHIDKDTLQSKGVSMLKDIYKEELTEDDHAALNLIKELRGFIHCHFNIVGFSKEEINTMLDFICTQ